MTDYKNTLNLPVTDFPMKADLAQREPNILRHWENIKLYERLEQQGQDRPKYILHDGPPYANAAIHLGTALNKILKDIVVKSKILSGFHAPFVPGWDCHGLPIELVVEKKSGKAGQKLSFKDFRKACRDYASSQVELQKKDFIRLGVLADWQHPYLTMNYSYEADAIRSLAKIIDQGYLVRGFKPVYWCTDCASALAEAEVEYKDKSSPSIDVSFFAQNAVLVQQKFKVKNPQDLPVIFPIWTTTPWTLIANQAVAVNPDLDYVLVKVELNNKNILLIIAEGLLGNVMHRYGIHSYEVLATEKGRILEGLQAQHPFLDRKVPLVLGEHVSLEAGTGNVHTAPVHGPDDYALGRKYHLPLDNPIDARSCFFSHIPLVGGLHVFKANEPIILALADSGHLLHRAVLQHSYPHCWRHKTPLIFRTTPQWFISMEAKNLRQQSLSAIEKVSWLPQWGQSRIASMIAGRPDWCISRQRTWGIPITLYIHKKTGELHPSTPQLMEVVAQAVEKTGVDAWYEMDIQKLIPQNTDDYEAVTDTLDVWFDSGVSHACVLEKNPELRFPADLYLEGSDQHRGWFQTSLLTSLAMHGQPPFKKVLTHGYVVDGKGYKMSKSLGNYISASEVMQKMGADILRLWVASTNFTNDIPYSEEIIKHISEAYRRIRNTARFLLSNLFDFDPAKNSIAHDELLALDRYSIELTQNLQKKIIRAYEDFDFALIYQLIHNFCTVEMGSFYLDIIKDRAYTSAKTGKPRRSAQTALYIILETLVRWLAPILSFTAEEIWQHKPGVHNDSIFLNTWWDKFPQFSAKSAIDWPVLISVRNAVNKILEAHRNQGEIGSALEAEVCVYADKKLYPTLVLLGEELRFLLITSEAKVFTAEEKPKDAEASDMAGLWMTVRASENKKCVRCWHRRIDVGTNSEYPEICKRCVLNISEQAEQREFV